MPNRLYNIRMRCFFVMLIISYAASSGCQSSLSISKFKLDLSRALWAEQVSQSEASLRGLCVVNSDVAWASGSAGTVLRTIDGGATWQRRSINHPGADVLDYRDVQAFDADRALMLSAGLPARIYRTTDGGESWTEAYRNDTEGVFFDGFAFWDDNRGVAFSDPVGGSLLIISTEDGGKSWQDIDSTLIPKALEGEAGFAASGTGIVIASGKLDRQHLWIGLGGDTGKGGARVFHSGDGGRTWDVIESPIASSSAAGIFSIAFRNATHGVMVGGDYQLPDDASSNVAFTTDAGRTWQTPVLDSDSRPRGYRSVVCYLPRENAYISGGPSGTDFSLDGGRTWQPLGDEGFHVIATSPDGAATWAAGADGRIARLVAELP